MTRKYTRESDLTTAVIAELRRLPRVKAVRRNVGKRGYVKFGETGEADIQGWVGPHGIPFAIELKMPGKRRSEEQIAWANEVSALGVRYLLTDDLVEAVRFVAGLLR